MKVLIDKYFLEEACPFTQRRKLNGKTIKVLAFSGLGFVVLCLLVMAPGSKRESGGSNQTAFTDSSTGPSQGNNAKSNHSDPFNDRNYGQKSRANRQYSAGQLVKRSDGGNSGDKLPMGSTIAAKLVNAVFTSDSNSPVIAEITDDVIWKNSVIIPANTRVIGQGTLDPNTERLQTRFNTLVYPEGDQHSISALALLPDGSSGIGGDFHSRTLAKRSGRFFGNFVGGLAQGMQEKQSSGNFGLTFEPGSLKNGLLNGLSSSAFDQANAYAQETEKLSPYLEVPGSTPFVLFLEKEYSP